MMIAFDSSKSGNVRTFVEKLQAVTEVEAVRITEDLVMNEPFIVATYTTGFGQASPLTLSFLKRQKPGLLQGVMSSGNRNWGVDLFARSADVIANLYHVPILHKFEMRGQESDVAKVRTIIEQMKTEKALVI